MQVLKIQNASIVRDGLTILDRVSLSIKLQQNTAIVGPNGAGKTTLLKLITREFYPFPSPDTTIEIFGQTRWNVWDLRHRLGIVSSDLQQNIDPRATGRSVILSGFYSSLRRFDHQAFNSDQLSKADQLMVELGVDHLSDRSYVKMSTGEKRRFLLARALIHDPAALILDEPTSGLDLQATFQYIETAQSLIARGTTIILVTHHIHEIPPEIENVILLKQGRIIHHGKKQDVLSDQNLTQLFDVSVKVISENGFYHVVPA